MSTKAKYYDLRKATRAVRGGRVYFIPLIYAIAQDSTISLFFSVEETLKPPQELYSLTTRLIRYKRTGQLVPKRWRL